MPFPRKSIPFLKILYKVSGNRLFSMPVGPKIQDARPFGRKRPVFFRRKTGSAHAPPFDSFPAPLLSSPIFFHLIFRLGIISQNQNLKKCRKPTNCLMLTPPQLYTVFHKPHRLWKTLWRLWKSSGYPQFYQSFTHLWTDVERCPFAFPQEKSQFVHILCCRTSQRVL